MPQGSGSPPFFPSLGTMPLIDGIIQLGRGIASGVLGQTYDVRRLLDPTPATGSISSQIPVWTNFPARIRRTTSKLVIEDDIWGLICYIAMCDNRVLQLLDEMTETGYEAMTNGCYIFVQARPTRETLWMRAESNIAITRMMPTAGSAAQQPSAGWVADTVGLGTVQKDTEHVLTLNNGVYAFSGSGASPASIQCGLQPTTKVTDTSKSSAAGAWPTALYREKFLAYVPLLPGEQLNELDRLNFPNSDRYEIATIYTSELTGIAGTLLILEKLGV